MKILHVLPDLDPAAGGVPIAATRLAAAQASLGHDVTIATYRAPHAEERIAADLKQLPSFAHVHVEYLATLSRMECLFSLKTRPRIGPLVKQFDIVHIHGVWDQLQRLASLAARRLGVPYVVTPHGMLDPWSLSQSRLKKQIALKLGYRSMLEHASFIHALNRDEGRLFEPMNLHNPVRVIPNGINIEEFDDLPPRDEFGRMHPDIGDAPYVLFLSRLHPKKGLDYLIDAFALVAANDPKLKLVIAGPDDGAMSVIFERIKRLDLADRVYLPGLLVGREKLAALSGAACFCLPSRQEGFSMAVTEAMASGVPVVISEQCHFPEVAETGAGFVLPLDAKACADTIRWLLGNPDQARQMGTRGQQLVRERFTWPAIAKKAVEAYSETIQRA